MYWYGLTFSNITIWKNSSLSERSQTYWYIDFCSFMQPYLSNTHLFFTFSSEAAVKALYFIFFFTVETKHGPAVMKSVQFIERSFIPSPQAMLWVWPGEQRWGWYRHGDATGRHKEVQEADQGTNQIHPTGDVARAQETSGERTVCIDTLEM